MGKTPQPEADRKQAGWVKSGGMGKTPQPEAYGKQAGWVKSVGMGKTPQYMSHADACVGYHAITW